MHLIHLPIEPFPLRYSGDWLEMYTKAADAKSEIFILGERSTQYGKITDGAFLDVIGTQLFKSSQIGNLLNYISSKKNDLDWSQVVIFFHDLWNPQVETLFYVRDALKLPFKIVGCLHAGTYDSWDFLTQSGMARWAAEIECSWFQEVDGIFVATNFHKDLLKEKRCVSDEVVHVTGFPMRIPSMDLCVMEKEDMIVFPHRLNVEKQPSHFDELERQYNLSRPDVRFVRTMSLPGAQDAHWKEHCYYRSLRLSKIAVSFALQETWGIAMQEAVFCGCIPLVPNRLSYKEMYPDCFKYNSKKEFYEKMNEFLDHYDVWSRSEEFLMLQDLLRLSIEGSILLQKKKMEEILKQENVLWQKA